MFRNCKNLQVLFTTTALLPLAAPSLTAQPATETPTKAEAGQAALPARQGGKLIYRDATIALGMRIVRDAKKQTEPLGRVLDLVVDPRTGLLAQYVVGSGLGPSRSIPASALHWNELSKVFVTKLTRADFGKLPAFDAAKLGVTKKAGKDAAKDAATKKAAKPDTAKGDAKKGESAEKVAGDGKSQASKLEQAVAKRVLPQRATLGSIMGYDIHAVDKAVIGRARKLYLDFAKGKVGFIGIRIGDRVHPIPFGQFALRNGVNARPELALGVTREDVNRAPRASEANGLGIEDPRYRAALDLYYRKAAEARASGRESEKGAGATSRAAGGSGK